MEAGVEPHPVCYHKKEMPDDLHRHTGSERGCLQFRLLDIRDDYLIGEWCFYPKDLIYPITSCQKRELWIVFFFSP